MIYVTTESEDYILYPCKDKKTDKLRLVNLTKHEISAREFNNMDEIINMMDKLKQAGRVERFMIV